MITNNFPITSTVINNDATINFEQFSQVEMKGSIIEGDGLVIQDGLIDFKGDQLNTEIKQLDTSAYTNVPNVFIKASNTIVDHGTHKDYDNQMLKLTIDCMDNDYANIAHSVAIGNNTLLQKIGGVLVWDTISSVQVDELNVLKLYSTSVGYPVFLTSSSQTPNASVLTGTNGQLMSFNASNVPTVINQSALQIAFSQLTSVPSYFIYNGASKQYILNTDFQDNTLTESKFQDGTIDLQGSKVSDVWLTVQWLEYAYSNPAILDIKQALFYSGSGLVSRQPDFTDMTGQATNSQIQSITFSKISNPSAALSLVQTLNTSPTTGQIMKYNGTNLVWDTDSTVTLNALLTALNTQTVVNLSQIQSNATATKQFFQSLSGTNSFNTIAFSDITGQISLSQIIGAAAPIKFLSSTNYSNSWVDLYFSNINGSVDLTQLPKNATATNLFLKSVSNVQTYSQINFSDLQNVPSRISNIGSITQSTGQFLRAIDNSTGIAFQTVTIPSIPSQAKAYIVNDATGTLTYVTGTPLQLCSFDGSSVPFAISQSTLSIAYSQLTSVPAKLTYIANNNGTNGQFLQTNGSGTIVWADVSISSLNSLPQQNNLGFIGTNQGGSTTGKNMAWITGGNPSSDQLYYAQYASSNNSSWQVISGTNGNGGVLTFRQNQTLQNTKGDNTQIYNQLLCYNTVTQQPEWQNMNGTSSDFLSGQNTILSLQSKAIANLTASPNYNFLYKKPVSTSIWQGINISIRPSGTIDYESVIGLQTNGDLIVCPTGSASWSLWSANSILPFSASGVGYSQRGYFNSTNWGWSIVSDISVKNIYDYDYQADDILEELLKLKFKKWTFKDCKTQYINQKPDKEGEIKQDTKKNISPCWQDLQHLRYFNRCIEINDNAQSDENHKAAHKTVDWNTFSQLGVLCVKKLTKKVFQQQEEINDLKDQVNDLKDKIALIMSLINK